MINICKQHWNVECPNYNLPSKKAPSMAYLPSTRPHFWKFHHFPDPLTNWQSSFQKLVLRGTLVPNQYLNLFLYYRMGNINLILSVLALRLISTHQHIGIKSLLHETFSSFPFAKAEAFLHLVTLLWSRLRALPLLLTFCPIGSYP